MYRHLLGLLLCLQVSALPVALTKATGEPGTLRTLNGGVYELELADGVSVFADVAAQLPKEHLVLEFDYFCLGSVPRFAVVPGEPFDDKRAYWSEPLGHSETWTPHRIRLSSKNSKLAANTKRLRLDLPASKETTLRIRRLEIRPERPGEFTPAKQGHADSTTQ